jgi:hypothetical protein
MCTTCVFCRIDRQSASSVITDRLAFGHTLCHFAKGAALKGSSSSVWRFLMQTKLLCKNGGHEVDANPRLKGNQLYCGAPECQRARKRTWQKNKMATDKKYRRNQIACLVRWRKEHALHRYQKQYRQDHPEYVEKNREKQRLRNDKRRQRVQLSPKIVKMDAFQNQAIKSGVYWLAPCAMDASQKIVKMDALLVELKKFHDDSPIHIANTC